MYVFVYLCFLYLQKRYKTEGTLSQAVFQLNPPAIWTFNCPNEISEIVIDDFDAG